MVESVTFEPESLPALAQFLKENNNKYHEIWIIITNKKTASIQPGHNRSGKTGAN